MIGKSNILIIQADQMRYDCAGFSGNPDVKTPNLDRLAMEGVCFDEAFVSYPLCRPFRASFQTGRYPQRTGAYSNRSMVDPSQPSLARALNAAGYKSGYIGKWQLHNYFLEPGFVPPGHSRMGYDDFFAGFNCAHRYMNAIFYLDSDQPYNCRRFEPDFQTDHAIYFMERARASSDPFLAYVSFGPPHVPMNMPKHWLHMYDPERIALPKGAANYSPKDWENRALGWGTEAGLPSQESANKLDDETEEWQIRKFVSEYYGLISSLDFNVGRLLNWLDAVALAESTIVMFFSDHGDMMGQHGGYCKAKNHPYRAAAQIPLLVRCSGRFASGKRVSSLVDVAVDTMPTLLHACGCDMPEGTQGISYLTLLEGSDIPTRDHVQYLRMNVNVLRGIRTKDWLYVTDRDQPVYLFDQDVDRDELVNLVDDPAYAGILAELDAWVRRNMDETGDSWEFVENHVGPRKTRNEIREHLQNVVIPAAIEVS